MKTEGSRPGLGYRNDKVFRSAELLLSSRPPKKRIPRWILFSSGIALGVIGALFVNQKWGVFGKGKATAAGTTKPAAAATAEARTPTNSVSSQTSAAGTTSPQTRGPRVIVSPAKAEPALTAPVQSPATLTETTAVAALPAAETTVTQETAAPEPALPAATFITLRGELRAEGLAPVPVELVLNPEVGTQLGKVNGVVRYMQGDQRVTANILEGEFQDSGLVLRETKPLELEGVAASAPTALGREFVIRLPANSTEADDLSGTWSFRGATGTLLLARRTEPATATP